MNDRFKFQKIKNRVSLLKRDLPIALANAAENFFSKSFLNQGWDGKKWQEVQRRIPGTNAFKYPYKKDMGRRKRPILIGKGATKLRRAVANSARVKVWPTILLVVDLPYAKRHNEGLAGMPKRTFMKDSPLLRAKFQKIIKKMFKDLNKS